MKKITILLVLAALCGALNILGFEKPETPDVDSQTRELRDEIDSFKRSNKSLIELQNSYNSIKSKIVELDKKAKDKIKNLSEDFEKSWQNIKNKLK